ncbi:hypothetical protein [Methylopila sp. M107]|uniref:hypothetical protein n=1 Tax=Methylopila sp. M107 TaxID=1101190 RepID=UPI000364343F|nr:hypothetical protein [Methylopila sp. M107]
MLVLHVGPHKTATTYLQSNFKQQRAELRRKGWLYPVIGVRTALAHHEVVEHAEEVAARDGPVFASLTAAARRAQRDGLDVLLSAEGFRTWKPKQVRALNDIFGSGPLRIVYVLRDPMTVIRSMWAQSIKLGGADALPDYLALHLRRGERSRLLNPLRDLAPHLRRDRAEFTILLYDEIERRKLDIYATFAAEALGLPDARPIGGVANPRHSLEMTEFLRLLTTTGAYSGVDRPADVGDIVRLLFSPEERAEIERTIREHGAPALRTIGIARDTAFYEELETRLREAAEPHFRPRPAGGRLFGSAPETWSHYDAAELMRIPEIAALVTRAAARLKPGGLRVGLVNASLRAVMAGRKLRNIVATRSS